MAQLGRGFVGLHEDRIAMGFGDAARIGVDQNVSGRELRQNAFFCGDHASVRFREAEIGGKVGMELDMDEGPRRPGSQHVNAQ